MALDRDDRRPTRPTPVLAEAIPDGVVQGACHPSQLRGLLVLSRNRERGWLMIGTAAMIAVAIGSVSGFLSLLAILGFLWKVYDRGGRADLSAASRATRDVRPCQLVPVTCRRLRPPRAPRPAETP